MGTHPIFESDFDCLTDMSTTHTILLVQPTKKAEGRTYSDYESVNDCMEGVCRIYEEHLKKMNPSSSQITYDIAQVCSQENMRSFFSSYYSSVKKLFEFGLIYINDENFEA